MSPLRPLGMSIQWERHGSHREGQSVDVLLKRPTMPMVLVERCSLAQGREAPTSRRMARFFSARPTRTSRTSSSKLASSTSSPSSLSWAGSCSGHFMPTSEMRPASRDRRATSSRRRVPTMTSWTRRSGFACRVTETTRRTSLTPGRSSRLSRWLSKPAFPSLFGCVTGFLPDTARCCAPQTRRGMRERSRLR